jgi:hypothetical protein
MAYRIRFSGQGSVAYVVEKAIRCEAGAWTNVREGQLFNPAHAADYKLVSQEDANAFGLSGLLEGFCYDSLATIADADAPRGIAIIPVKDLTEQRSDRISLVMIKGPEAEISFF